MSSKTSKKIPLSKRVSALSPTKPSTLTLSKQMLREAWNGNYAEVVKYLKLGADVHYQNDEIVDAYTKHDSKATNEDVDQLLLYGLDVDTHNGELLQDAVSRNDLERIKDLIHIDGAKKLDEALLVAVKKNRLGAARILLDNNADPSYKNNKPLYGAVDKDNAKMIKLLIDYGADDLDNVLNTAIDDDKGDAVHELLINPSTNLNEALIRAINNNNASIVEDALATEGVDPNYKNNLPLRLAIKKKNQKLINLLVKHGADTKILTWSQSIFGV